MLVLVSIPYNAIPILTIYRLRQELTRFVEISTR